jgi:hypothetical protein
MLDSAWPFLSSRCGMLSGIVLDRQMGSVLLSMMQSSIVSKVCWERSVRLLKLEV